jgi:putative DNA primase/helicase
MKIDIATATEEALHRLTEAHDRDRDLEVSPPGQPMPNVRRFLAAKYHHAEHQLLVHQGGQFYIYDGTCWPPIEDALLRSNLYRWFESRWFVDDALQKPAKKPFAPTARKVTDLFDALRGVTIIDTGKPTPSWFGSSTEKAEELIACENGLIHWPSRTLHNHTPRFYCHHSVPFAFDPNAPQPKKWLSFLGQLWGEDQESISCLQEVFGYLVSGDTSQQKILLLVGPKRGGKGTIARVLAHMLGRHNVAGPTLSSLGTNFGLQDLIARPVAIISDARLGSKSDHSLITERLLSISGEDLQNVDRKFQAPWSGRLPTRFVILSNELPRLSDSSGALASRFVVLMLTASFYGKENPKLTEELCTEIAGIFNWALDGLQRLRARGHFRPPAASQEAIQALEDLASPVGAFIREQCEIGPEQKIEVAELYSLYREWCQNHGHHVVNRQVFGRDLRAVRPEVRIEHTRQGEERRRKYVGLGLAREARDPLHCTAHDGQAASPSTLQSKSTRASRATCQHCGRNGELITACCDGDEVLLHPECTEPFRALEIPPIFRRQRA